MEPSKNSIVLIGMAGAGKSTIGPLLAAELGLAFQDTDTLIESAHGCSLQEVLDRHGLDGFQRIEEQTLLELHGEGCVTATGGSAVYYPRAMEHLRRIATVVWLQVDLAKIEKRVRNQHSRGLVSRGGQSLADLFRERQPLYRRYAHLHVNCRDGGPTAITRDILALLNG